MTLSSEMMSAVVGILTRYAPSTPVAGLIRTPPRTDPLTVRIACSLLACETPLRKVMTTRSRGIPCSGSARFRISAGMLSGAMAGIGELWPETACTFMHAVRRSSEIPVWTRSLIMCIQLAGSTLSGCNCPRRRLETPPRCSNAAEGSTSSRRISSKLLRSVARRRYTSRTGEPVAALVPA